jgi:hypothetical protein
MKDIFAGLPPQRDILDARDRQLKRIPLSISFKYAMSNYPCDEGSVFSQLVAAPSIAEVRWLA